MLLALLLGLAMNFLAAAPGGQPGIEFASKHLLRRGVALLGCPRHIQWALGSDWRLAPR
jgi:uncharacterized membrane protein YadS